MTVQEWIRLLQNENQNAEVRWKLFWKNELDNWDVEFSDIQPEQAFDKELMDQLDIHIFFHSDEDEDD